MDQVSLPEHWPVVVQHIAEKCIDTASDARSESFFLDQFLVQQAIVALYQDLIEQTHRIPFCGEAFRHMVGERKPGTRRQRVDTAGTFFCFLARLADIR